MNILAEDQLINPGFNVADPPYIAATAGFDVITLSRLKAKCSRLGISLKSWKQYRNDGTPERFLILSDTKFRARIISLVQQDPRLDANILNGSTGWDRYLSFTVEVKGYSARTIKDLKNVRIKNLVHFASKSLGKPKNYDLLALAVNRYDTNEKSVDIDCFFKYRSRSTGVEVVIRCQSVRSRHIFCGRTEWPEPSLKAGRGTREIPKAPD